MLEYHEMSRRADATGSALDTAWANIYLLIDIDEVAQGQRNSAHEAYEAAAGAADAAYAASRESTNQRVVDVALDVAMTAAMTAMTATAMAAMTAMTAMKADYDARVAQGVAQGIARGLEDIGKRKSVGSVSGRKRGRPSAASRKRKVDEDEVVVVPSRRKKQPKVVPLFEQSRVDFGRLNVADYVLTTLKSAAQVVPPSFLPSFGMAVAVMADLGGQSTMSKTGFYLLGDGGEWYGIAQKAMAKKGSLFYLILHKLQATPNCRCFPGAGMRGATDYKNYIEGKIVNLQSMVAEFAARTTARAHGPTQSVAAEEKSDDEGDEEDEEDDGDEEDDEEDDDEEDA